MDLEGGARGGLHPLAIDVADVRLEEGRVVELTYVLAPSHLYESRETVYIYVCVYIYVGVCTYLANHGGGEPMRGQ